MYAFVRRFPQHERARDWLDTALSGPSRVGVPWESLVAFVRVVTNPRLFPRPSPVPRAWAQVEAWLDAPATWTPAATDRHRETLGRLVAAAGAGGALVHDAHLAALALEHGLTLCSADADFARFPGLRWENPLAA